MSIVTQNGPASESARDPFRGAFGMTVRRADVARRSISAEAAGWNDCLEFSEVEVADRDQRLGGGAVL